MIFTQVKGKTNCDMFRRIMMKYSSAISQFPAILSRPCRQSAKVPKGQLDAGRPGARCLGINLNSNPWKVASDGEVPSHFLLEIENLI